jgi:hypothetical protein
MGDSLLDVEILLGANTIWQLDYFVAQWRVHFYWVCYYSRVMTPLSRLGGRNVAASRGRFRPNSNLDDGRETTSTPFCEEDCIGYTFDNTLREFSSYVVLFHEIHVSCVGGLDTGLVRPQSPGSVTGHQSKSDKVGFELRYVARRTAAYSGYSRLQRSGGHQNAVQ